MAHSNTLFAQVLQFVCEHDFALPENGPFKPKRRFRQCRAIAPRHGFKCKNRLYFFGAYVVDLCMRLFPWARLRKSRSGVKLHTLLDHDGLLPAFVKITEAKVHEVNMARTLTLPGGSIVVFDRAMVDYAWFNHLNRKHIFFVTRAKRNMRHKVVARRKVLKQKGLTCDQTIFLTGAKAKDCPIPLCRIGFVDRQNGKRYVFPHQQLQARSRDHRGDLPRAVENRALLQMDQAEP